MGGITWICVSDFMVISIIVSVKFMGFVLYTVTVTLYSCQKTQVL